MSSDISIPKKNDNNNNNNNQIDQVFYRAKMSFIWIAQKARLKYLFLSLLGS